MRGKLDKHFLILVLILAFSGFLIFTSASMGMMVKKGTDFFSVASNQTFLGLILGLILLFAISFIDYKILRKYSFWIFILSIGLNLLLFVPGLGLEHGGAKRWIIFNGFTFQPSEFLKIGYILYFATLISHTKEKVKSFKSAPLIFLIVTSLVGLILLSQPDTDTFFIIVVSGLSMLFVSGAKWKHLFIIAGIFALIFSLVALSRPYVMQRIKTFIHPSENSQTTGYQGQQSIIAIGSGQITGKGFGQSIQKFTFLPEPTSDSIFAVAAEEFGFVGAISLIIIYILFAMRGLKIGLNSKDSFGGLVCVGIVILIVFQSFFNIASMLGIIPLSGIPLLFVSQGGTALLMTMAEVGIILSISRER